MLNNILFANVATQEELFNFVATRLEEVEYVTPDYREALKAREQEFPTGLKVDLNDGSEILYAAIPHTETKYCLVDRVVYVKNDKPLIFKHMINPEEDCYVQDFFFIVNSKKEGQTDILSNLITFFTTKGNLEHLHDLGDDKEGLSEYLIEKGVFTND
ncbi:PTS galactose transporter subunit IIA [Streptococcus agalactiae LMG 14747]|uniref:PTS galactose transporter subunit IIA n=2 Tax=Streptococcus TaxID=1301 RepID=V6Z361_STRAG|nr:PTS sugar transporter subunit IIA [Streptococcus acidominimus]ESV54716.1 PTS galactose transporter subunit IIA [Streptococcus agalactiae LMG 14747]SNV45755.1 phosphoenolpyruvate-dependent sugar phosphotransferase system, EIIA 2 family protein [Streptococcus acidominimus]